MNSRSELLSQLLHFERPIQEMVQYLAAFSWDSEKEMVVLTLNDVRAILQRFISGELSENEVQTWANAIEGRDDVGFQKGGEAQIKSVLFELANPDLSERLNVLEGQGTYGGVTDVIVQVKNVVISGKRGK